MSDFTSLYDNLNSEQQQAVNLIEGPVLVLAGPGTGKTQMLAMRIANILRSTDTGPGNVLCLTFTEAGTKAMRKRLLGIVGQDAYKVSIHTFHSFCNEVIQTFPDKFTEFSANPTQLDDVTRIRILQQVLDGLEADRRYELRPFHNPYQYQFDINSSIQTLKREGVSPDDLQVVAQQEFDELNDNPKLNRKGKPTVAHQQQVRFAQKNLELVEIYRQYRQMLEDNNYYDYEDMILKVIERFETDPELLAYYWENYLYVLVDEYQDTNGAQNEIIKLLGSFDPSPNIFAVGDDDQAIYRFQGANVENLLFFEQQFANVQTITVSTNYRSNQAILDAADGLISSNQNRLVNILPGLTKRLTAGRDLADHKPELYQFGDHQQEARFVAEKIANLIKSGADPSDIAVLYRRHSDAEDMLVALQHNEVPTNLISGTSILEESLVQKFLVLLKLVNMEPAHAQSFLSQVLLFDFIQNHFKIDRLDIFKLLEQVKSFNYFRREEKELTLVDLVSDPDKLEQLELNKPDVVGGFLEKIADWRSAAANEPMPYLLSLLLEESGVLSQISHPIDIDTVNAFKQLQSFVSTRSRIDPDWRLAQLISDLDLMQENNLAITTSKDHDTEHAVNLLTAHSAKGLEFKHVFIVKAFDGNWGGRSNRRMIKLPDTLNQITESNDLDLDPKQQQEEDERRLFFVALTRAQEHCYITYADVYPSGNSTRDVEPTRFTSDIGTDYLVTRDQSDQKDDTAGFIKYLRLPPPQNLNQQEQDYLRKVISNFKLSASALNEYLECPLKFKFNRLLRVPSLPSEPISLGNSVHKAMELMSQDLIQGKEIEAKKVLADFERSLAREPLGYESYQRVQTEGRALIQSYLENYRDQLKAPAAVEYNFGLHHVMLELDGQEPVRLAGKIDKIEWVDEDNQVVRIVDYKTSSPKSENVIMGKTKNSDKNIWRQLVFYVLLAQLDSNFKPKNKINKYVVDHVRIDFIKAQNKKYKQLDFNISDQDIDALRLEIAEVMSAIRNLDFTGSEDHPVCGECDYCKLYEAESMISETPTP